MSQENGLPINHLKNATIGTDDWAKSSDWVVSPTDSTWTLEPDAGEAIIVHGVLITFSEKLVIPAASAMIITAEIDGWVNSPVEITRYSSLADLFDRSDEMFKLDYSGATGADVTQAVYKLRYDFSQPLVLWSSGGTDAGVPRVDSIGNVRFQRMVCKIGDDQPYEDGSSSPAETVRSRYLANIYTDPFYT